MVGPTRVGLDRDIAALIALWIALHRGDPPPSEITIDETAVLLAAALDSHLAAIIEGADRANRPDNRVEERLTALGIEMVDEHERAQEAVARPPGACICFGGSFLHKAWGDLPVDHPPRPETFCVCA